MMKIGGLANTSLKRSDFRCFLPAYSAKHNSNLEQPVMYKFAAHSQNLELSA